MVVDVIFSNTEEGHLEILSGNFKTRLDISARILVEQYNASTINSAIIRIEESEANALEIMNFKILDRFESCSHLTAEQITVNGKIAWNSKQSKIGKFHKI
jgi:hypothetical protein